jgi:hypothetical protein
MGWLVTSVLGLLAELSLIVALGRRATKNYEAQAENGRPSIVPPALSRVGRREVQGGHPGLLSSHRRARPHR